MSKSKAVCGFAIDHVKSCLGMEGIQTSGRLWLDGILLGDFVLDGDGGADRYHLNRDVWELNAIVRKRCDSLPSWCDSEYEPVALSYVVAMLADTIGC